MTFYNHFSKIGFWEEYYNSKGTEDYDWFQKFSELRDIFRLAGMEKDKHADLTILDIGCGTSQLLENFYLQGFDKLVGVDFCKTVVDKMKLKYQHLAQFEFFEMDALETEFIDHSFDRILDKGLLDCILVN
jgi:ubiquinone/menaquinone biosynthesis C-methylase UbiE